MAQQEAGDAGADPPPRIHGDQDARSDLEPVRRAFEQFGRDDPMYAALSQSEFRHNRWDPAAFFATGVREIDGVMAHIAELGVDVARSAALDFGCAVGRLTQALARHFDTVVGVDLAEAMIARARELNRHGDRVDYVVNTTPDLARFPDGSFDFVYTNKVLQHIPPALQLRYVAEFVRVLRPQGLAVFQVRNGPRIEPGTLREALYTLNRRHFRRFLQRLRGRTPYEMHYISRSRVEEVVREGGARVVDVVDLSAKRNAKSLMYYVQRG